VLLAGLLVLSPAFFLQFIVEETDFLSPRRRDEIPMFTIAARVGGLAALVLFTVGFVPSTKAGGGPAERG